MPDLVVSKLSVSSTRPALADALHDVTAAVRVTFAFT